MIAEAFRPKAIVGFVTWTAKNRRNFI